MKRRIIIVTGALIIFSLIVFAVGNNTRKKKDNTHVDSYEEAGSSYDDTASVDNITEISNNTDLSSNDSEVNENKVDYSFVDEPDTWDEQIAYYFDKEQEFFNENGNVISWRDNVIFGKHYFSDINILTFSDINDICGVIADFDIESVDESLIERDQYYYDNYNQLYFYISYDITNLSNYDSNENATGLSISGTVDDTLVVFDGWTDLYINGTDYPIESEKRDNYRLEPSEKRHIDRVVLVDVAKKAIDIDEVDIDNVKFYLRIAGSYSNAPDYYLSEDNMALYIEIESEDIY